MTGQKLVGYVDVLSPSQIYGWAANLAAPGERVSIAVRVRGEQVAELTCADLRADVAAAGIAGGRSFSYDRLNTHLHEGFNDVAVTFVDTGDPVANGQATIPTGTSAQIADHWSTMYQDTSPIIARWWQCDTIVRHVNERVCGKQVDGLSSGLYEFAARRLAGRLPLQQGISVGCGEGSKEMEVLRRGIVQNFALYELSQYAIASAQSTAARNGMAPRMRFVCGDAFALEQAEEKYDLVFWNASLHHMFDVEAAIAWSWRVLREGGVFLMDEFVGPTRMQSPQWLLDVNTRYRESLPDAYLVDPAHPPALLGRTCMNPDPLAFAAADPSECADSGRILPSLAKWFPDADVFLTGGGVYALALSDVLHNIVAAGDMAELERALRLDDECIERGESHHAAAVGIKKTAPARGGGP